MPFPPPGDLPDLGIEPTSPVSPTLQEDSLPAEPAEHYTLCDVLQKKKSYKGDQSWVFIDRTDVEAETPILWPPDAKS